MYFSDDPEDRKYEKLMRLPPYHRSRGYGVYVFDRRKPTIILCGVETPIEDTPLAILLLETAKAFSTLSTQSLKRLVEQQSQKSKFTR